MREITLAPPPFRAGKHGAIGSEGAFIAILPINNEICLTLAFQMPGARDDLDFNQSCYSDCHGHCWRAFCGDGGQEHGFGFFGHTIAGAIGGGLSGYFLQQLAVTVVTANGSLNEITTADNAVMQGLAGIAAGGCLTLVVGFIKHSVDHHQSHDN
jgi:hypothetical protein